MVSGNLLLGDLQKRWGTEAGVVRAVWYKREDGIEHTFVFVVSRYRKRGDYGKVVRQLAHKGKLSAYQQDLFDSCFKNW